MLVLPLVALGSTCYSITTPWLNPFLSNYRSQYIKIIIVQQKFGLDEVIFRLAQVSGIAIKTDRKVIFLDDPYYLYHI